MENKQFKTQAIVEIGLMSALLVVITMMNAYVPLFNTLGIFIIPLPITVLYLRHNISASLFAILISGIIVSIINNPLSAIGAAAAYGFSGLAMGYCLKNKRAPIKTVVYVGIANLIGTFINMFLFIKVILNSSVYTIIEEYINEMKKGFELSRSLYGTIGVDVTTNPLYESLDKLTPEIFMLMIPAAYIIVMLFMAYINYIVTRNVLKRLRYQVEPFKPFNEWYLDSRLGAMLVTFVCIGIILNTRNIYAGQYITGTFMSILQMALLIQALSLISYLLKFKFNMNKTISIFILLFLGINPSLNILLLYMGLADMLFDFRKLDPNSLYGALSKKYKK